jgi:membrane fusion protein, multidrug efflux system
MPPDVTQPQPSEADPAPAAVPVAEPPEEQAGASEPKTGPGPTRLRRLVTVGGAILGVFALYQIFVYFVAYTDDAYVRSDLVAVASEVTGPILLVHVVDNQDVKKGDKLFTIDPEPFQLVVNQRRAQIDEQKALLKVSQEELASAQAALAASTSAHTYAQEEQRRYADLAKSAYAPRAELDKANDELRRTTAEMRVSELAIEKAQSSIVAHQAALNLAMAEMATAQWRLSKTEVLSPTAGSITNLTVRAGDMANASIPIIGIVDAGAWRIMANYKQDYIRSFTIGGTAWVWLDSQPWHLHRAKIVGIARGFSREPGAERLLPYVAPTTDWIRLQRRIPVTIVLENPPPDLKLYMGADARTVIFP